MVFYTELSSLKIRQMNNNIKNLDKLDKKLIILVGHMGSGKTLIGKILARKLGWEHFDSDKEIELNQNLSINKIFKLKGEDYFRKIEVSNIKILCKKKNAVISLGGGSIMNEEILNLVKKTSISIFLKVDIDELVKRLKRSKKRPLLINENIKKIITVLNNERMPKYEEVDFIINNNIHSEKTVANIIKYLIKNYVS